jgi:hypothetical protein
MGTSGLAYKSMTRLDVGDGDVVGVVGDVVDVDE